MASILATLKSTEVATTYLFGIPFGSYTNDEWYLHMLVKGKEDKEINYTPMSFFKTKYKKIELEKYIQEQYELEDIKTV